MKILAGIFLATLLAANLSRAQTVPAGVSYQGRLTNADSTLAPDGSAYEVEVRLWTTATGGTMPLWAARYSSVSLKSDSFSLFLGAPGGTSIGGTYADLKAAFTGTSTTYLGITITRNGDGNAIANPAEILPRQQVLTSPYSFRAEQATNVDSNAIISSSIKNGEVVSEDLASGAVTLAKFAPGAVVSAIPAESITTDRLIADYASFWEEQPGNVGGGASISGWMRRTLNAGDIASPAGGISITRSGNSISLGNGTYLIRASGPHFNIGKTQLVMRDVTGSPSTPVVVLRGSSEYTNADASGASTIDGFLKVINGPRQFELWQYFAVAGSETYRLGYPVNEASQATAPEKNVYTRITIQKIN